MDIIDCLKLACHEICKVVIPPRHIETDLLAKSGLPCLSYEAVRSPLSRRYTLLTSSGRASKKERLAHHQKFTLKEAVQELLWLEQQARVEGYQTHLRAELLEGIPVHAVARTYHIEPAQNSLTQKPTRYVAPEVPRCATRLRAPRGGMFRKRAPC